MDPPLDFANLSLDAVARAAGDGVPPVDRWHPPHCGDSRMRIASDGRWFHDGAPIERPAMVRLFSSILRREEDGGYVLVTPVEKLSIVVEDAPFVAAEARIEGDGERMRIAFRLNTGEIVLAGAGHPLRMKAGGNGARPYVRVRGGLDALVSRTVFYELAERAAAGPSGTPGVWSDGVFFGLGTE